MKFIVMGVFLLKGNPQIKVWSQELCGREDTQQKVADIHARIKMLSWGNYKRDEIRDKKLGRKRKSGWGSRYSVPAEETTWQIRGPKDAMGRRKGWRWGFLEEAPQTTLRSPSFITATTETIQGDHQKAQKRQETCSELLLWALGRKRPEETLFTPSSFVFKTRKLITRKSSQRLSTNQEFWVWVSFPLHLTAIFSGFPISPTDQTWSWELKVPCSWTPFWSHRSLHMFYIYQILSLKSSKYSINRLKRGSTEDCCGHSIPQQSHFTDQLCKGRCQTLCPHVLHPVHLCDFPWDLWLYTIMELTAPETQSVPRTTTLTVIQETIDLVPALASNNCGTPDKNWPLTGS